MKKKLIEKCLELLNEKLKNLDFELEQLQKSANEETKSSAGDKYETGRAMLMIEKEKLATQQNQLFKSIQVINQIDPNKQSTKVELGSLVDTTMGNYFIASSLGPIEYDKKSYFVISAVAPVAQKMLGLKSSDQFNFNGKDVIVHFVG